MGYSPWGRKESDTTERLNFLTFFFFFFFNFFRLLGEECAGRAVSLCLSGARSSQPHEPEPKGLTAAAERGGP